MSTIMSPFPVRPSLFAVRLRSARALRALTQEALATAAGLQASTISHFEAGTRKPALRNLCRLADALEVSTDYLVGRTALPGVTLDREPVWDIFQALPTRARAVVLTLIQSLGTLDPRG